MASFDIGQMMDGGFQECRMPESKEDSGSEICLPIRLGCDDFVHKREEAIRVILNLDVDVEGNVLVFRLKWLMLVLGERGAICDADRACIRRETVSAKVGMCCLGSLRVCRCSIPSSPYQFRSLIKPGETRVNAGWGLKRK